MKKEGLALRSACTEERSDEVTKGFTLIELLVVIALIGILAVALLSAINPIEQSKKARDAGRKSDAAELLNALERYNTTYNCFPWNRSRTTGLCGTAVGQQPSTLPGVWITAADFVFATGSIGDLINVNELKTQFQTRAEFSGAGLFSIYEANAPNGQVSVCFEPESVSWRNGGGGALRDRANTTAATCGTTYSGVAHGSACYVCVPQ